jgi:L-rhamnose mutarotase
LVTSPETPGSPLAVDGTHHGRRARVVRDRREEYKRWHRAENFWPEMADLVRRSGFRHYAIYLDGDEAFAAFEAENVSDAQRRMSEDPVFTRWMQLMAPFMDAPNPTSPWTNLERIFWLE